MGDRCVPVPSHLCAIAYDDDGCKVSLGKSESFPNGTDICFPNDMKCLNKAGHARAGGWTFRLGKRCSSGGTPSTTGTGISSLTIMLLLYSDN